MTLYILVGFLPLEDLNAKPVYGEAGYTFVYDSKEALEEAFPGSDYIEISEPDGMEIQA